MFPQNSAIYLLLLLTCGQLVLGQEITPFDVDLVTAPKIAARAPLLFPLLLLFLANLGPLGIATVSLANLFLPFLAPAASRLKELLRKVVQSIDPNLGQIVNLFTLPFEGGPKFLRILPTLVPLLLTAPLLGPLAFLNLRAWLKVALSQDLFGNNLSIFTLSVSLAVLLFFKNVLPVPFPNLAQFIREIVRLFVIAPEWIPPPIVQMVVPVIAAIVTPIASFLRKLLVPTMFVPLASLLPSILALLNSRLGILAPISFYLVYKLIGRVVALLAPLVLSPVFLLLLRFFFINLFTSLNTLVLPLAPLQALLAPVLMFVRSFTLPLAPLAVGFLREASTLLKRVGPVVKIFISLMVLPFIGPFLAPFLPGIFILLLPTVLPLLPPTLRPFLAPLLALVLPIRIAFTPLLPVLAPLFDLISPLLKALLRPEISRLLKLIRPFLRRTLYPLIAPLLSFVKPIFESLQPVLDPVKQFVDPVLKALEPLLGPLLKGLNLNELPSIKNLLGPDVLGPVLKSLKNALPTGLGPDEIVTALFESLNGLLRPLVNNLKLPVL